MDHELRHLQDHLNTPRPRTGPIVPSPQLQRLRRRKEEDYPEDADHVWDTEDFSYATTDWDQDEWEHFAFFMNAIKDRHEAASAMNDTQETSTARAEVNEMERAIVASRHFLGPELLMLGRVKRNGAKQTFTWNRYEFFLAKHWTTHEWIKFVECVHEIADGLYTKQCTRTPQMQKFLDTYPVQVFKCNKALMKDYINELSGHYEKETLGRDNVMAHEDRKSATLMSVMQNNPVRCPARFENKYLRYNPPKSTPMIVD